MDDRSAGFYEIEHTADWALHVWASSLPLLFSKAAEGMYWLMQTTLAAQPRVERSLEWDGVDTETLLVSFLSDLLYLGESESLGFDQFELTILNNHLRAVVRGAPVVEQNKEIKAVTYHNLAVQHGETDYQVTIVFDV